MIAATLAVLAGGEGSRMGRPKGELSVEGKPILQYLLERWNWAGAKILVTAPGREYPPGHELFDREVHDAAAGEGPLRGIVTALENAGGSEVVIVATCDMPLVTREMLEHPATALQYDPTLLGMMTRRGDAIEPFPFAARSAALSILRQQLQTGRRSVYALASMKGFGLLAPLPELDESAWTNLNDPAEYERFVRQRQ